MKVLSKQPQQQRSPEIAVAARSSRTAALVASVLLAVAFLRFLPLLGPLRELRADATDFFWHSLCPVAVAHILCLVALSLLFPTRAGPVLVFWGTSLAGLLAVGQLRFVLAFLLAGLATTLFVAVGDPLARAVLPPQFRPWTVALGFGMLICSLTGSVLAWFHLFWWWSTALALAPLAMLTARRWLRERTANRTRSLPVSLRGWNFEKALALECVLLLTVFTLVAASAPETRSDAIRIYWPYVKLLHHFGGFIEMPFHWSYIIPQPGVPFVSTVLAWFGPVAVRFSMFIALISLIGISSGGPSPARPVAAILPVVVGASPVVLLTALSVMQDTFVSLVVLLLAVVCIDGDNPGSVRYWTAVGGLAGLAWCAKYSTACYAIPLGLWALFRGRSVGWGKNLTRCLGFGGSAALAVAVPWLAHSYAESGNPVFPFLRHAFPSPLWTADLKAFVSALLHQFALRPGIHGVLFAPWDLTFHTNRFLEGPAGNLGLAFAAVAVLAVPAVIGGGLRSRLLIAAGVVGTLLVWQNTAYVRYWLPGLWLLCAGVAGELERIVTSRTSRTLAISAGAVLVFMTVPFTMVGSGGGSKGWPWDLYRGVVSEEDYLASYVPGLRALRKMERSPPAWPRFCYTGFEFVGDVNGVPLFAELWELELHGTRDAESIARYIQRLRCDYWAVKMDSLGARWLRLLGVEERFWKPENLFASDGAIHVYRLPAARPLDAVRDHERALPAAEQSPTKHGG